MSRVLALNQELQACPGFMILAEIRSISITRAMNERNYSDLQSALSTYATLAENDGSVFPIDSPHDESEIINVMRLVHNYLASSKTLIDHTRRIVRDLCAEIPFLDEYNARVHECFVGNPLSHFVQDLRNLSLHRSIPLRGPTVAMEFDGTISGYYKLDRESLSEWNGWSRPAQQYLAEVNGHLLVNDLVYAYHNLICGFHRWLEVRLREVFAAEIQEEEDLRQEIRNHLRIDGRSTV